MAERPKPQMPSFDVSDVESKEKPATGNRKRPGKIAVARARSSRPSSESLPGVPGYKRSKKEDKEVSEAMKMVNETIKEGAPGYTALAAQREKENEIKVQESEEAEWEAKIAEAKGNISKQESAEKQGARVELAAEAMEASEAYENAKAKLKETEETISIRSNEINADLEAKGYTEEQLLIAREEKFNQLRLNDWLDSAIDDLIKARKDYESAYAAWEKTVEPRQVEAIKQAVKKDELEEEVTDEMIVSRESMPPKQPASFSKEEKDWFKQGDKEADEEARQMAEAREAIELNSKGKILAEKPEDIEGAIKTADALIQSGHLSLRNFSSEDYSYLLKARARIDKELEHAGWWKARGLRKQLSQIQKGGYDAPSTQGLDDYEEQIEIAKSAATGQPMKKEAAPTRKLMFWERLKMSKGR